MQTPLKSRIEKWTGKRIQLAAKHRRFGGTYNLAKGTVLKYDGQAVIQWDDGRVTTMFSPSKNQEIIEVLCHSTSPNSPK